MTIIKLFLTFLKIGLFTLGSGYSMLVLAERYVVGAYHWLTIQELTDVVAIAEITPGPFIINLATFVGTKVAGFKGAVASTAGLVLVPFIALYVIALNYAQLKGHPTAQRLLSVARPMAIGFITVAILKLFKTAVPDLRSAAIAVAVIALTYVLNVNPIFTVLGGIAFALIFK